MRWPWSRGPEPEPIRGDAPRRGRFRVLAMEDGSVEVRASAGAGAPPPGRTEQQRRDVVAAVVLKAIERGQVSEGEARAWANELMLDFWSALDTLGRLPEGAHPRVAASAPWPRRGDGEALVARGVREGRIPERRRAFWLARYRVAPGEVERLMTAAPEAGGLVPMPVAASAQASLAAAESEHRAAFAATFAREAAALGYAVPARSSRIIDRS